MAIVLYGASGKFGGIVLRRFAAGGVAVRVGGRDATRLAKALASMEAIPRSVASLDDGEGLRALLNGCRVVVNAGPTVSDPGDRLLRAALDAGVHYIDAAGSQAYIRRIFEQYSQAASDRGIAIAPAFGLDYALGDCLARLTACHAEPATDVTVAYAIEGADVGSNSLQFAAETPGGGEVFYESGRWRPASQRIFKRTITFPQPFGQQPMARYGAGEVVTVPRHTRTESVTALITTRALVPHPALVPWFPYLRPVVAYARQTPLRHLLRLVLQLRARGSSGATPPTSALPPSKARRFAVVVEARAAGDVCWRGIAEGGDFHEVTTEILTFGAQTLASPTFAARGVLPPAAVVDPATLLDSLAPLGVTWKVERIDAMRPQR